METYTTQEFEFYFKTLYKPLCLFALRLTGNMEDAEDVVQQVFADLWDNRTNKRTIGNLKSYIYSVVRNRSINLITSERKENTVSEFDEFVNLPEEEQISQSERDARLWNIIDNLPPERKKIFLMSKRDGMKYKEIAEELNLSVKTVENQIGKALKALRDTAVYIYRLFLSLV